MPEITRKERILIVDDDKRVRRYAAAAFRDFPKSFANHPDRAVRVIAEQQQKYDSKKPFDLLSCDINMPRGNPTGVVFMEWFHETFADIPIICHSDDSDNARKLSFVRFVHKLGVIYDGFNVNEAALRAAALDILDGGMSFDRIIEHAKELGVRRNLNGLNLPKGLENAVYAARNIHFIGDILAFFRAGYIDETTTIEIIRFAIP